VNILFIYPNIGQPITIHHGIASLSSYLKCNGHNVSLSIVNRESYLSVKNEISKENPDIICFSIVSNYWETACRLAAKIKKDFDVKIFAGGIHCSIFPESFTVENPIDGICRGEGEEALLELVQRIESNRPYHDVKNFWFKNKGRIVKNEIRPLIRNLDLLPFSEQNLFLTRENSLNASLRFIFSRGCLFNCSYCSNKAYKEIYKEKGNVIRFRSVEKAIEEIKIAIESYPGKILAFDDDCFNKNLTWFKSFAEKYRKEKLPPFQCNTRPELITESSMQLLKEAGCQQINIGIESGDMDIRKNLLNRPMSDDQIIKAFRIAKKYGIKTYSFNMIGIPGETIHHFKKTIKLNQKIQPDGLQISIFYPYPGTDLGKMCINERLIRRKSNYNYFYGTVLRLKNFNRFRILFNKLFFRFNVFKTKSYIRAFYYLYLDVSKYLKYIVKEN